MSTFIYQNIMRQSRGHAAVARFVRQTNTWLSVGKTRGKGSFYFSVIYHVLVGRAIWTCLRTTFCSSQCMSSSPTGSLQWPTSHPRPSPLMTGGACSITCKAYLMTWCFSMGNTHQLSLQKILAYLDSEHEATKGSKLRGFWTCKAGECPQQVFYFIHHEPPMLESFNKQENTADCGVFLCLIAESIARGAGSGTFTQADMPYLRFALSTSRSLDWMQFLGGGVCLRS